MSQPKKIEIQYELCKTCNGTGRNFFFSHSGQSKPRLGERLCSECYGLAKRPVQLAGSDPQAVAVSAPPAAQDAMKAVLALAEQKRAAAALAQEIAGQVQVSDDKSVTVTGAEGAVSEPNASNQANSQPN